MALDLSMSTLTSYIIARLFVWAVLRSIEWAISKEKKSSSSPAVIAQAIDDCSYPIPRTDEDVDKLVALFKGEGHIFRIVNYTNLRVKLGLPAEVKQ